MHTPVIEDDKDMKRDRKHRRTTNASNFNAMTPVHGRQWSATCKKIKQYYKYESTRHIKAFKI